ncbi:MAG: acetyl-CoA carboxylase biotin carboxylase subunit [Anaerolineae bacterium]|nr:acetyl-CoA carboxylase biotin carboxylase subunit [Anaerolineae bacterium]
MIKKLLVANRGEIAGRIFRACRELNVTTVAVYSDIDADAPWVRMADEAYPLNGATATETYLNQSKLFAVCDRAGVDAIHPGYGFLSENADFATACAAHSIKFVGPSPQAMEAMGSKARAREIARQVGVPIIPGVDGKHLSDAELLAAANRLGYPVLIKASAGGGGKGMRVVNSAETFHDALQAARREALSSFGNDHIILEKYFTWIYHVEVQILGDEYGNVVHLFERECSIQRRHQKIIEETPSPFISDVLRSEMTNAATKLARAVGYASAGTVEFMVTPEQKYYLLEMNTRLQVEHPITELVTGIDIAAWQIRVAAGESLSFTQDSIQQRGHAIECRIYAEDPANNFLPSIGTVALYKPPSGPSIRVDDGIETGSAVSPYYDPMLAKVVAWGTDRTEAVRKMVAALKETVVLGVTTNIPYLLAILHDPQFLRGDTSTNYLNEVFAKWQPEQRVDDDTWLLAAALEALQGGERRRMISADDGSPLPDPWDEMPAWRNV